MVPDSGKLLAEQQGCPSESVGSFEDEILNKVEKEEIKKIR